MLHAHGMRVGAASSITKAAASRGGAARSVAVRSVATTPAVNQEAAVAPSSTPAAAPAVPVASSASSVTSAPSALHYSREELAELTLRDAQNGWVLRHQNLAANQKEYENVLALAQSVVPNVRVKEMTYDSVGALANPSAINNGQVGYWRPMARLLLLKETLSAADLANPTPYASISYEEAESLLLDEAAETEKAEKEADAAAAAALGLDNNLSAAAAKQAAKEAAIKATRILMDSELGEDLCKQALNDIQVAKTGDRASSSSSSSSSSAGAAAGDGEGGALELEGAASSSSSTSSSASGTGASDAAAKESEAQNYVTRFTSPLMQTLEHSFASSSSSSASSSASSPAGKASVAAAAEQHHLTVDLSPPVTGALTFMRIRGNPAPSSSSSTSSSSSSSSAAASAAEEAVIEGALAAGAGHPSPNQLHPLATLWLSASTRYLQSTVQRLQGNLEAAKAAVKDKRPGSSKEALAAVGLDLATSEEVISRLASVPMQPLSAPLRQWLKGLSVDQLDSLLSALSLRRRGVTVAGNLSTAPDFETSSPLALRIKKIEAAINVLTSARNGEPVNISNAAAHLVRYPTLRQVHAQLLQALSAPAPTTAMVPGFSDVSSAAAARLAQYGGVVALEATKLQAALQFADTTLTRETTFLHKDENGHYELRSPFKKADAAPTMTMAAVQSIDASQSSASLTLDSKVTVKRGLVDPATPATATGTAAGNTKAASAIVAKQLNAGHLPTLLQPLSFVLSPAEWTGLVTTTLVAAPSKGGFIAHPPKMGAVTPAAAAEASGASDGSSSSSSPSPAVAADDVTLEQTSHAAAATRGLKALMGIDRAAASRLEDGFKQLEAKLADKPEGKAVVEKLRKQVGFAQKAVEAGAFDGRTASLAQVLESLLAAAREVNPVVSADGKVGLSSAYADDVPALIKWCWARANASSPEAMLEGRVATLKTLDQQLSEVAAVSELSHLVNDAAAAAFASDSHVYSFGRGAGGSSNTNTEEQLSLASLTQVIPLPLEAASGLPLPSLLDHNGRVIGRGPSSHLPVSQPLADPSSTNPLSALWPTPSVDQHKYYPLPKSKRLAAVPRGDGFSSLVPRVRSLPPELTVTSVYGETGASSAPAASRVIDEFIASKALEEAKRNGTQAQANNHMSIASLLRRSTDLRASEVAVVASDSMVSRIVDAAIKTMSAAAQNATANATADDTAAAAKAIVENIKASPLGIGAGSDVIPSAAGGASTSTPGEASSVVNLDASALGEGGSSNASDGSGGNTVRPFGETAELALSAMDGSADVATPEAMGGLPVMPSANPARTRAAKLEALVTAVLRTAKAKAASYNLEHGLRNPAEDSATATAPSTGPDGLASGSGSKGAVVSHITPDLVKQVEIALATNTGVPVVKEDGTVILVDPNTGGLYSGGAALQWRNYEYEPSPHYRGRGGKGGHADSMPAKGRFGLPMAASIEGGEAAAAAAASAAKGAAGAEEEALAWSNFSPYSTVHKRIAEAMEARDLGAVWSLFTEHKRMRPQEGDPDFLLYEMVMDACAQAKRADLLFEVLWPEVCRLRMVVTDTMVFLLFKGACLSVEPKGSPNYANLARAETIFKHHAATTTSAAAARAANGGDGNIENGDGMTRSWYVALISACLDAHEPAKAFNYFNALKKAGYEADAGLYSHMAAKLTMLGRGEELHHLWRAIVRSPNFAVPKWLYTQLIVAFARMGNLQDMEECRERMRRRIDRFQKPEPLAVFAMVDAYVAAGLPENAQQVLDEFKHRTPGIKEMGHLSVGLQSALGWAVGRKLQEAQLLYSSYCDKEFLKFFNLRDAYLKGNPDEATLQAYRDLLPWHKNPVVQHFAHYSGAWSPHKPHIAKGVADSCVEGLVAAYSRPQVIPPPFQAAAASLVPAPANVPPVTVMPGLLSIPALTEPARGDTLGQDIDSLIATRLQLGEGFAVARVFAPGKKGLEMAEELVVKARMHALQALSEPSTREQRAREAFAYGSVSVAEGKDIREDEMPDRFEEMDKAAEAFAKNNKKLIEDAVRSYNRYVGEDGDNSDGDGRRDKRKEEAEAQEGEEEGVEGDELDITSVAFKGSSKNRTSYRVTWATTDASLVRSDPGYQAFLKKAGLIV